MYLLSKSMSAAETALAAHVFYHYTRRCRTCQVCPVIDKIRHLLPAAA
ncbi:MAG: hypothetical protein IKD37_01715 [Clostridia bacterium]|nr:hypothetical protein [Clostridia bacterium]